MKIKDVPYYYDSRDDQPIEWNMDIQDIIDYHEGEADYNRYEDESDV